MLNNWIDFENLNMSLIRPIYTKNDIKRNVKSHTTIIKLAV